MLTKTMVTKNTSSPHGRKQETHKNATSKTKKKTSPAHERGAAGGTGCHLGVMSVFINRQVKENENPLKRISGEQKMKVKIFIHCDMKNCKPLVVPCKVHKVGGQHDIARSDLPSPESLSVMKNHFHFLKVLFSF